MSKDKIKLVREETFGNSPAANNEAEEIMIQLVKKAIANDNTWTDIPLEELNVGQPANRLAFESPTREGIINLTRSQWQL